MSEQVTCEKDRKMISWRLERLSDGERALINAWADKQDNIQQSITNIVLHSIKRFGVATDIMNFDVQQILHAESFNALTGVSIQAEPIAPKKVAPVAPSVRENDTQKEENDGSDSNPPESSQGSTQNEGQGTTIEEVNEGADTDNPEATVSPIQNDEDKDALNNLLDNAGKVFKTNNQ